MTAVRFGIVGCGHAARTHLWATLQCRDDVVISDCFDARHDAAVRFQRLPMSWGHDASIQAHESLGGLLASPIDGLIVATWPTTHADIIAHTLHAGIRYILCEKPLAMNGDEVSKISQLADRVGGVVIEAHQWLHHPFVNALSDVRSPRHSIRAEFHVKLTKRPETELNWRFRPDLGGGVALDDACYPIQACNYFMDAAPRAVNAVGRWDGDVLVGLTGVILYEQDYVGFISASCDREFRQELHVICGDAAYSVESPFTPRPSVNIRRTSSQSIGRVTVDVEAADSDEQQDIDAYWKLPVYQTQLRHVANVIRGTAMPVITLEQSLVNAKTLDAALRSIQSGRNEAI